MDGRIKTDRFNNDTYIRFAEKKDITEIMRFIREYWAKDHILASDRELFEFQYVYGDEVCFVLSLQRETDEIEGVLGYIPYDTEGERDIFTALWKVKKGKNMFQGMELLYYLEEHADCRNLYCAGINESTFSIYKYMKKKIACLEHYYMLNPESEYLIARVEEKKLQPAREGLGKVFEISSISEFEKWYENCEYDTYPRKSRNYLRRRYFEHPEYEYLIYGIEAEGKKGLLVGREQNCMGHTILRLVDYIGEEACLAGAGCWLQERMRKKQYEYIDMLQFGISQDIMRQAGFVRLEEEDSNIIPNYFEPFVQENITVFLFYPENVNVRMLKGDGDQDRPNYRKRNMGNRNGY